MSDKKVIGTCSECGGPVEQYMWLHTVGPFPPARCRNCGAVEDAPYGPTIKMVPSRDAAEQERDKIKALLAPLCSR